MRQQKGFTLVELVVVVMILGILAAVAAPKLLGTSSVATENGLKQTLSVVRDAIERYAAENGGTPPSDPMLLLTKHLRGAFPTSPVGTKNAVISIVGDDPLAAEATPGSAWLYNASTGQFICNSQGATSVMGVSYDEL